MRSVMLLNSTNEVLSFISEKKAFKMMYKNKVEIVSSWINDTVVYLGSVINFPAVLKLKYYIHRKFAKLIFSKRAVLKRDEYQCKYCGKFCKNGLATVDHIIPRSRGGESSFINCVAACPPCNKRKANKMPDEANMKLMTTPAIPSGYLFFIPNTEQWHNDWEKFLFKREETAHKAV